MVLLGTLLYHNIYVNKCELHIAREIKGFQVIEAILSYAYQSSIHKQREKKGKKGKITSLKNLKSIFLLLWWGATRDGLFNDMTCQSQRQFRLTS